MEEVKGIEPMRQLHFPQQMTSNWDSIEPNCPAQPHLEAVAASELVEEEIFVEVGTLAGVAEIVAGFRYSEPSSPAEHKVGVAAAAAVEGTRNSHSATNPPYYSQRASEIHSQASEIHSPASSELRIEDETAEFDSTEQIGVEVVYRQSRLRCLYLMNEQNLVTNALRF